MKVESVAGATIIHVSASLDDRSGRTLSDSIGLAETGSPDRIVVSLLDCVQCESSCLAVLLKAWSRMGPRFSTVVPLNTSCRRTFEATGLAKLSFVVENLHTALTR